jgi:hypothetical protein
MLALLKDRAADDPVPVRIPVSLWDTRDSLDAFLTQHLARAYGWPKAYAAALVGHGMVLPVLDGLDEMDPTLPDGAPDPAAPRARAALEHLDGYRVQGAPGQVILTCRTTHLEALDGRGGLRDSAQVTIAPVTRSDAVAYLSARANNLARWQPLIHHLMAHPASALATWLSTPWRLCLVATVYHLVGDPHELTGHTTAQALDEHLLARFIPAASRLHPHPRSNGRFRRQRTYHPGQVHQWLHHLAHALTPTTGTSPAPGTPGLARAGTDLVLHELWPLAGRTRVLIVDATLTAAAVLLTLPLAWSTGDPALPAGVVGVTAVIAALLVLEQPEPNRLGLSGHANPSEALVYGLVFALPVGLVFGLMVGMVSGLSIGLVTGLAAASATGLVGVLGTGLESPPSKEARPWELLRDDLPVAVVYTLPVGLVFGLMVGLVSGLSVGLVAGSAFGLMFGLASAVVRRYVVFLLCSTGRLPFRLVVFLEWACEAGLLRYAGSAYQFRHRELQQWLTAHPEHVRAPSAL